MGWQKTTGRTLLNSNLLIAATFAAYLVGLIYWYRWVYRMHKVLRETTDGKYPVSPRKSVGYQFIPFYNLVWNFKWPNRIADFVRQNSTTVHMRKGWVGFWLLAASLVGTLDKGLGLVLLFTISAYLARKIRRAMAVRHFEPVGLTTFAAVPYAADPRRPDPSTHAAPEASATTQQAVPVFAAAYPVPEQAAPAAWDLRMSREWKLPVSSGIGAAFGFLMCYGFWFLLSAIEQKGAMLRGFATEGTKILLVAIVLYFFLEPLADLLLEEFHVQDEHRAETKLWQKIFRFAVFVVIVDVAHSLLERAAEEGGGFKVASLGFLLTSFFGGMTYLWISGAPKRLREALALVGPGLALLLIFGVVVVAEARQLGDKLNETSIISAGGSIKQRLHSLSAAPSGAEEFGQEIANSQTAKKDGIDGALVLACAVFVAVGGFAAMRKKLGRTGVAATVFVASLLSAVTLVLIPYSTLERFYIVITLWAAFWWCLGILAFYDHEIFQSSGELSLARTEPHVDERFPRPVWLVSSLILLGLFVAAYLVRPHGKEIAAPTLNIIADDKERPYGAANPELTSRAVGLVHGDKRESTFTGEPSLCSAAGLNSPPGVYPIAVGPGTGEMKEEKYKIRFVPGSLKVVPAATRANLESNASRAPVNSPVTFRAAIAPQYWGTPSGTVTFYADESPIGRGALSNGTASYTAGGLPVGAHLITAKYDGDANFSGSSSTWTQQIIPPPEAPPRAPVTNVIPAGTEILIATIEPIDSNTTKLFRPLMATLASPLVVNGRVLAQKGSMAILALTDLDPNGSNGKPGLTINLARLEIAGKSYQLSSTVRMQSAAGSSGRIHISRATVLSFRLESPITTDIH